MVVTAGKRLKSENGASLVAALLFFVLCGVAASMILAAASASAGKMQQVPVTDQKRFAVESGAAFLRDELSDSKTAVKITDVRVVDSREEEPDYSEEYVYTGGETLIIMRMGNIWKDKAGISVISFRVFHWVLK